MARFRAKRLCNVIDGYFYVIQKKYWLWWRLYDHINYYTADGALERLREIKDNYPDIKRKSGGILKEIEV
jgi:hypothetical protein